MTPLPMKLHRHVQAVTRTETQCVISISFVINLIACIGDMLQRHTEIMVWGDL